MQKEFEGVESAVENLIGEITSRVKLTNMDDFLEDSVYSDEKFILLLKNFSFGFKDSGMMFWDLESKVVNVGDYMVSQNFASILKSLFEKYGDISANSTLCPRTKTFAQHILWSCIQHVQHKGHYEFAFLLVEAL